MTVPMAFAQTQTRNSTTEAQHKRGANMKIRVEHRVNYLSTVLSLSNEQHQKAMTIFSDAAKANSPVFANLRTARKNLSTAVKSNEPASTIKELSNTIGNEAGQLVANEATAREQFYQILNPEQRTKLSQLRSERWGHYGMGARGAMGF